MARHIARGNLDYHLTLPKNVLWQVSTGRLRIDALGDFFFGVAIYIFLANPTLEKTLILILLILLTAFALYAVVVIYGSLAFFFGSFEEASERLLHLLLNLSLYPAAGFYGALKIIAFTIVPAFALFWLPVSILKDFSWWPVLALFGFAVLSLALANLLFKKGLKRYESGNLLNVKM